MRSLRILIIEDDVYLGTLLSEMLGEIGHSICGVETTEAAAVKTALSIRLDLMIIDARLGNGQDDFQDACDPAHLGQRR